MTAGKTAFYQSEQTATNQERQFDDHLSMQAVCMCKKEEKDHLLLDFFTNVEIDGRSFVFCNGIDKALHLYSLLKTLDYEPIVVDSSDTMEIRRAKFKRFRENTNYKICIVTHGTEIRYAKIYNTNTVFMYDLPRSHKPSIPFDQQDADLNQYAYIQRRLVTDGYRTQGVCMNLVDSTDGDELRRFDQIRYGCISRYRRQPGIITYIFHTRDPQTLQATDVICNFEDEREIWMEI